MGLRRLIKNLTGYEERKKKKDEQLRVIEWKKMGRPVPPPHTIKQEAINHYREEFNLKKLVETGTYLGDMVNAQRDNFEEIISIELDQKLYNNAINKFKKYKHIKLYQGDSGEVLAKIVPELKTPCLFWLDGHYSAGITAKGELNTPIKKELDCIFKSNYPHVILIDDAREFIGKDDYPTIAELKSFVESYNLGYQMSVEDDIIRLFKR